MKSKEKKGQKDQSITFTVGVNESLANAIRRYVNEILILAVDEVEIMKNDSAMYDETIAHRLGLVPLKMDKTVSEKGVKLKLVATKEGAVYSRELKGGVKPVYDNMPITVLNKDQELEIGGEARVGKGSEHAKFSPGLMFYKNLMEIKTGNKGKEAAEIISKCPNKCGSNTRIENNKTIELDICDSCEHGLEKAGIEINPTNKLVVYVESFGQLDVKKIVPEAIKQLKKDLVAVSKKL